MSDLLSSYSLYSATALAAQATLTTPTMDLRFSIAESVVYQVTSVLGTPDIKIEWALSDNETSGFDFTALDDLEDSSAGVPAGDGLPEGLNRILLGTVGLPYMRLKFTGLVANPADTILQVAKFFFREIV